MLIPFSNESVHSPERMCFDSVVNHSSRPDSEMLKCSGSCLQLAEWKSCVHIDIRRIAGSSTSTLTDGCISMLPAILYARKDRAALPKLHWPAHLYAHTSSNQQQPVCVECNYLELPPSSCERGFCIVHFQASKSLSCTDRMIITGQTGITDLMGFLKKANQSTKKQPFIIQ